MHWFFIGYMAGHHSGGGGGWVSGPEDWYLGVALLVFAVAFFGATFGRLIYSWAFNKPYPCWWPR